MSLVERWVPGNQLPLRKGSKSQIFPKNVLTTVKTKYQILSDPRFLTIVVYVIHPSSTDVLKDGWPWEMVHDAAWGNLNPMWLEAKKKKNGQWEK